MKKRSTACSTCRGSRKVVVLNPMHHVLPVQMKVRAGIGFTQQTCPMCGGRGYKGRFEATLDPSWEHFVSPTGSLMTDPSDRPTSAADELV